MNLRLSFEQTHHLESVQQQIRVASELWAAENLFCCSCGASSVDKTRNNTKATDFICSKCETRFELKSGNKLPVRKIPDGAYETMVSAIRTGMTPDLVILTYDRPSESVTNLSVIPSFALSESAILKRPPTLPKGRKNPWVGCDIDISKIPPDGFIPLVRRSIQTPLSEVLRHYKRLRPITRLETAKRGWTLDVLTLIQRKKLVRFSTSDAYGLEAELHRLHPENNNIQAKIRQQLQVLRDLGLLIHTSRGSWELPH